MEGSKNQIKKILCPNNLWSNNASAAANDPQISTTQQHPSMITLKDVVYYSSDPSKDPNASTSTPRGTSLPTIQKVFGRRTGGTK